MSLYESQWVNRLRRERRSEDAETLLAPWIRLVKRRGWDLNPRATFRPPAVFKTAPFDRSGTPPQEHCRGGGLCSPPHGAVPTPPSPIGYSSDGRGLELISKRPHEEAVHQTRSHLPGPEDCPPDTAAPA